VIVTASRSLLISLPLRSETNTVFLAIATP
jgi:hypothetical protein